MAMFETRNDLPLKSREKLIPLLNARLADVIDLAAQAKLAHWNVKGPNFQGLHKLFDEVAGAAAEYVDEIAERVVQLGGSAEGDLPTVVKRSSLPAFGALGDFRWESHVAAMAGAIAKCGAGMRAAIDSADEFGDMDTADLFTEVSRGLDKLLWFVEAHAPKAGG